jgi:hypothetical protein
VRFANRISQGGQNPPIQGFLRREAPQKFPSPPRGGGLGREGAASNSMTKEKQFPMKKMFSRLVA